MEAAVLRDYESAPELGEFEEPSANGEAVVEVSVAGLNPVDKTIASGNFPGREPPLPSVPGLEGVGTLDGRRVYFDAPVAPEATVQLRDCEHGFPAFSRLPRRPSRWLWPRNRQAADRLTELQ